MRLRLSVCLILLAVATSWCVAPSLATTRPSIQDRINQRLVANGRMGLAIDTSSLGTLVANTPTGPVAVPAGTVTVTAPMHGSGSLFKVGSGTLTLTTASGYTAATTINSWTLQISRSAASNTGILINGGALNFTNGNVLNLANFNSNSNSGTTLLGSGGSITVGSGTIKPSSGSVAGSGGVILSGSNSSTGTLTVTSLGGSISGVGTITGGTTVTNGTVNIASNNYTGNTIGTLNGGTIRFDYPGTSGGSITFGSASLTKSGIGNLTLSGSNTYTGSTIVSAGTLNLGTSNSIATAAAITFNGASTLDLGSAGNGAITFANGNPTFNLTNWTSAAGGILRLSNGEVLSLASDPAATIPIGDIDQSGPVNVTDITSLESELSNVSTSSAVSAVPEPSGLVLSGFALAALIVARQIHRHRANFCNSL